MDSSALTGVSQGLVAYLPLGLPLGIAALFAWVVLRTESWHLMRRRIWQVTHGKGEITDPGIRNFVEEQTNLAAFRIFVGPDVATLEEARTLMAWCKVRNVDLGVLRICGDHFDLKQRRIKTGATYLKWAGRFWGICTMLLLVVAVVALELALLPHALLSVKASGQHFLASESTIRSVWPPFFSPTLTSKDCADSQAAAERMQFKPEDTAVMCRLLTAPEYKDYARKTISDQREAFVLLGIALLVCMYFVGVTALRCFSAGKLRKRGLDPALPASQMELDFDAPG